MSKYWTIALPAALCGLAYYAYQGYGFIPEWIRGLLDPLIELGKAIVNFIFGV